MSSTETFKNISTQWRYIEVDGPNGKQDFDGETLPPPRWRYFEVEGPNGKQTIRAESYECCNKCVDGRRKITELFQEGH